jgi:hypothetical protein
LPYGTALYKFEGTICANYKFTETDALITNVELHEIICGIPPVSGEPTTNPTDKDARIDWESENIPKPTNRTALFADWYRQMRNFNSQNASTKGKASYAMPYVDPQSSQAKGATILSALFEVKSIIDMYQMANFAEKYKGEILDVRNRAAAFDNATRLVSASIKYKGLPAVLLESSKGLKDLTNWIIDGTTSDGNKLSDYNQIIAIWGDLLINNYTAVINGGLFRPMELIIDNGAKDKNRDQTTVHKKFIVPSWILNPDVQDAWDRTNELIFIEPVIQTEVKKD